MLQYMGMKQTKESIKPSSKSTQKWAQYIIAGLVIMSFLFFHGYYYNEQHQKQGSGKVDLAVFYVAGATITNQADLEPIDLYTQAKIRPAIEAIRSQNGGSHYLYLPQAAILFAPATIVSFNTFAKIWAVLNTLLLLASFYAIICWLIGDKQIFKWRYTLLLAGLGAAESTVSLTATGQLNGLILALLVAMLIGLYKGKDIISGTSLAVAATIKVFPGIWFIYLAVKKKWQALLASTIGFIAVWLVSIPFFGWDGLLYFIREKLPEISSGEITGAYKSSSFYGSIRQAIRNDMFSFASAGPKNDFISMVDNIYIIITLAVLVLLGYLIYKYRGKLTRDSIILDYGLIILFVLLFAKIVHKQYHLWTLPIILYFWHFPLKKRFLWIHVVTLLAFMLTQFGKLLPLPEIDGWILKPQTIGLMMLATLVIGIRSRRFKKFYPESIEPDTAK